MIKQLLIGGGVFAVCVAIHAWAMIIATRFLGPGLRRQGESFNVIIVMVTVVGLLALFHLAEVSLWAFAMSLVGAVPREDGPLYFAFTSYTTLGYGDVIAEDEWKLLGPMAAMNGVMLFGWSTAVIFQVMNEAFHIRETHQNQKTSGAIVN